ncbi:MAG TPA: response regulator transcription factor [Pseudonocardia sp.]|nr:response regulator transcription factor [Pseudonocardia sp.]
MGECGAPRTLLVADTPDPTDAAAALAAAGVVPTALAADPAGAVRAVAGQRPDLVVVVAVDGVAGPAVVAAVADADPGLPVLVLVAAPEPHTAVLSAVGAGATSVVLTADELGEAARRTADGAAVFSPGLADLVLDSVSPDGAGANGARLTDRESDVLRLIVDGLTARQIATRLVLSQRTVENHVQNMLRKLGLTGRAALVRYAIENGLA